MMAQNDIQARWIVSQRWLPPGVVKRALADLEKQPERDLAHYLAERGLLSGRQAQQLHAALAHLLAQPRVDTSRHQQPRPEDIARAEAQGISARDISPALTRETARVLNGRTFAGVRIRESIARGGMGLVLRGEVEGRRPCALKLLLGADDPRSVERFQREAKTLQQLDHPHIVEVFDSGVEAGIAYFVMDFIDGDTLEDIAAQSRTNRLSVEQTLRALVPIARALEYCHSKGIIHRDLKPANILLAEPDLTPFLIDFGVVKHVGTELELPSISITERDLSSTGEIVGTPAFMAPEQLDPHGHAGPAADVWGFGATLFTCIAGRRPFVEELAGELLAALMTRDAPRLRGLRPLVPRWLDRLCADCLHRDPARRPPMRQVVARLERGIKQRQQRLLLLGLGAAATLAATIWALSLGVSGPGPGVDEPGMSRRAEAEAALQRARQAVLSRADPAATLAELGPALARLDRPGNELAGWLRVLAARARREDPSAAPLRVRGLVSEPFERWAAALELAPGSDANAAWQGLISLPNPPAGGCLDAAAAADELGDLDFARRSLAAADAAAATGAERIAVLVARVELASRVFDAEAAGEGVRALLSETLPGPSRARLAAALCLLPEAPDAAALGSLRGDEAEVFEALSFAARGCPEQASRRLDRLGEAARREPALDLPLRLLSARLALSQRRLKEAREVLDALLSRGEADAAERAAALDLQLQRALAEGQVEEAIAAYAGLGELGPRTRRLRAPSALRIASAQLVEPFALTGVAAPKVSDEARAWLARGLEAAAGQPELVTRAQGWDAALALYLGNDLSAARRWVSEVSEPSPLRFTLVGALNRGKVILQSPAPARQAWRAARAAPRRREVERLMTELSGLLALIRARPERLVQWGRGDLEAARRQLLIAAPFDAEAWFLARRLTEVFDEEAVAYNYGVVAFLLDPFQPGNWERYAMTRPGLAMRRSQLNVAVTVDGEEGGRAIPERSRLLINLAKVCAEGEDFDGAGLCLRRALELDGRSPEVVAAALSPPLSQTLSATERSQVEEIGRRQQQAEQVLARAEAKFQAKLPEDVESALAELNANLPWSRLPRAQLLRGWSGVRNGRRGLAGELVSGAVASPGGAALLLAELGRPEAEAWLEDWRNSPVASGSGEPRAAADALTGLARRMRGEQPLSEPVDAAFEGWLATSPESWGIRLLRATWRLLDGASADAGADLAQLAGWPEAPLWGQAPVLIEALRARALTQDGRPEALERARPAIAAARSLPAELRAWLARGAPPSFVEALE